MKTTIKIGAISAFLLSAGSAFAAPVDLSGWTSEGAGNWNVAIPPDSVTQSINGQPTVFHNGTNSQGTSLSGTIEVQTTGDDDFVGFVLGYDSGELSSGSADFWLVDWKQGNQGAAAVGLSLSHVTGSTVENDYWAHVGGVSEQVRATNLGSTGWADNTAYTFDLTFTSTLIEVFVDGILEISLAGSFGDGAFGFYNYSQSNVSYAGITEDVIISPVPLPAGLPFLFAALGALGLASRRRKS